MLLLCFYNSTIPASEQKLKKKIKMEIQRQMAIGISLETVSYMMKSNSLSHFCLLCLYRIRYYQRHRLEHDIAIQNIKKRINRVFQIYFIQRPNSSEIKANTNTKNSISFCACNDRVDNDHSPFCQIIVHVYNYV